MGDITVDMINQYKFSTVDYVSIVVTHSHDATVLRGH